MGRSQRHLEEFQGVNSADEAAGVEITISAPTEGAQSNPVTLTAAAFNAYGLDVSAAVRWHSDVDGPIGVGNGDVTLSDGAHVLSAAHSGVVETVEITVS